ncbi:MAG: methyltransferase domain-containing protein [Ferruginibacter sp.]
MKIINSIRWSITWFALALLKKSNGYRLKKEGAKWLQPLRYNDPNIVNRTDFILEYCRDKRVLHIGFTDHPYTSERINSGDLLHSRLKESTAALAGIDVEEDAIRQYTSITNDANVFYGDITIQYPAEVIAFKPQLILLSEVLEHLTDPYKAIEILYRSFDAGTIVLVTVPNYTSLDSLTASLHKTESIHSHHHWYFSPYTLRKLFDDKRFKLLQLNFGMYYQPQTKINAVLKEFPLNGDCIIALFSIIKNEAHA